MINEVRKEKNIKNYIRKFLVAYLIQVLHKQSRPGKPKALEIFWKFAVKLRQYSVYQMTYFE